MKKSICIVGPVGNYHIIKWSHNFVERGYDVHIVTLEKGRIEKCFVHYLGETASTNDPEYKKIKYLFKAFEIRKIISKINPNIISVHYASSYGSLVALSGIHGYNLSIWGSDIYDFPRKSFFHKMLIMYSLWSARKLLSTSQCMAKEAAKYTKKSFAITPFGVNTDLFTPNSEMYSNKKYNTKNGKSFLIGTIKGLEDKYGIKYLLLAAAKLRKQYADIPLQIRIAGKGSKESEYKKLATELGLDDCLVWLGYISQAEAAKEWAKMDVGIIYSESESKSFGVSAVEANACETAVIVSDIPGLRESTVPGVSSYVVEKKNADKLYEALVFLWKNPKIRISLGENGRENVLKKYKIKNTFDTIESELYKIR